MTWTYINFNLYKLYLIDKYFMFYNNRKIII